MKLLDLGVETDLLFVIFGMFDANILVSGKVELILLLLPIELIIMNTVTKPTSVASFSLRKTWF